MKNDLWELQYVARCLAGFTFSAAYFTKNGIMPTNAETDEAVELHQAAFYGVAAVFLEGFSA